jgi:excisionase family DNA binding protein
MKAGEVADLLRVTRASIDGWARTGRLRGRKVGRRWLFDRREVFALLGQEGGRE